MKYLFVVDLQREFVRDRIGETVYKRDIDYIRFAHAHYDTIFATIYKNGENMNMGRSLKWFDMLEIKPIEFKPDSLCLHSGYSPRSYPKLTQNDSVDIIGFDTDACVLSTCFDLWNLDIPMRVLIDGCWSSGGAKMHEHGLAVMLRQFGDAIDQKTKLESLLRS